MTLTHLDDTLNYLHDTENDYLIIKHIHKHLKKTYPSITRRQALLILDKLVKDGYVTKEITDVLETEDEEFDLHENVDGYYISFDGIIFKQSGGYIEDIVQRKIQKIL